METIRVINFTGNISENFTFLEYYKPKLTPVALEFDIPRCLVDGVQYLRDYWKEALIITSAYRPQDTFGFHKTGNAVDTVPANDETKLERIADFREECKNWKNSPLIKGLRAKGVSGFGVEAGCIHLDHRTTNCHLEDNYGRFCIFMWEADGTPNGKSTLIW